MEEFGPLFFAFKKKNSDTEGFPAWTRPLQNLHFVFVSFRGGLADVFKIIFQLQNPRFFELQGKKGWPGILL